MMWLSKSRVVLLAAMLAGCGQQAVHFGVTACNDSMKNGTETDVDCGGGTCDKCDDGKSCLLGTDCKSGTCLNGQCAHLPASCTDNMVDGHESDVDCGGDQCLACADGKKCGTAKDCESGVCKNGTCQPGSCTDMIKNGQETDIDCGGPACPKCDVGKGCNNTADCLGGGLCVNRVCAPATCQDGVKNGHETDIDCGGDQCGPCADTKMCGQSSDCKSGVCQNGVCQPSTCTDKVKNGDETDVDCGGASCPKCNMGQGCHNSSDCAMGLCISGVCAPATCNDGIKNGNETDTDCGGDCPKCITGKVCGGNKDCQSNVCTNGKCAAASCMDMVQNGSETDVDCGGAMCGGCDLGKHCLVGNDCKSGDCFNGVCSVTCSDGIKNGDETDVDCGGAKCAPCADGKMCNQNSDCVDANCQNNVCQAPSCNDMLKNGQETDVDCGGPICPKCATNAGCKTGTDCVNGICVNSQCQMPSCMDGVKNGNETDVDCGGPCPPCGPNKGCLQPGDCWNQVCGQNMVCGNGASIVVGTGQGAQAPFNPNGDGSKLVVTDGMGNVTVDRQNALLNIARYIYVSNSGEGTVSKIDPNTQKEVARYCTAPGCNADPSRASVSLDGNVGVANRANYFYNGVLHPELASAVMIAGDISRCVDRNGNGKIDTNTMAGTVPQAFVWPTNTTISPDECVLWWTPLTKDRNGNVVGGAGTLPRSATFDSKASADGSLLSSNFYVGLYGTSELAQLDAKTGAIKQQIALPGAPYSSVFDRNGILWIRDANTSRMMRVDTNQPNLPNAFLGPAAPCGYAISADRRPYVYSSGGTCVSRMDPSAANPTWELLALPNACFTRGPSLDYNYNLWVPDTCYGAYRVDASKPFGQGMTLVKAIPIAGDSGQYILGTAIDGTGYPWIINTELPGGNCCSTHYTNPGSAYRIDFNNNYAITKVKTGVSPYVYSDLSGSQLALSAPTTGNYNKIFQAFCGAKATWTTLTWTDSVPQATSIQVKYRAAADLPSLQTAPFVTVGSEPPAIAQPVNIMLPQGTNTSLFEVQFVISTNDTASKPLLSNISVSYTCP